MKKLKNILKINKKGMVQNDGGTYNGATDTFTPYQLTNENIISTLYTMMNEFEFWEFINEIVENEAIENNWHDLQYINELVHFYDIIIIKDERKLYIDMD